MRAAARAVAVAVILSTAVPICTHGLDPEISLSQYIHDTWEIEDGLPQNSVHAVTQDGDGFLWLATLEGLVRFDGVSFEVFNKINIDSVTGNEMRSIHLDGNGVMWVASYGSGLIRMEHGRFTTFDQRHGLEESRLWHVTGNEASGLWLATTQGLFRYDDAIFTRFTTEQGLAGNDVRCVHADDDGRVWAGTMNGLNLLQDGSVQTFTTDHGLAHNKIKCITRDRRGRLWVGTHTGLNIFDEDSVRTYTVADGLAHDSVTAVFEDSAGTIWIGTESGVSRFHEGTITSFSEEHVFSRSIVRSFFEDHEGSLWIGTETGGLGRLRQGKFIPYTRHNGLEAEFAWSFLETGDGRLLIGTSNGLAVMRDGLFSVFRRKADTSNNWISSIFEGGDGTVWVGTNGDGLFRFRDGMFLNFPGREELANDFILSLDEDSEGNLWIGTRDGLRRLRHGKVSRYGKADGLAGEVIRYIETLDNGEIWIGTGTGLSRYRNGRFTNYFTGDGLSSNAVFSIHADPDGTLWFGTYGGGLNRYRDGTFRSVTSKQGLFDDVVYVILEDDHDNLWMTGNKGVFRVAKQDFDDLVEGRTGVLESPSYGVADGMISRECNGGLQPAGCRTRDGRMWFPTIRGPVVVDPSDLRKNDIPPPVHVMQLIVDGTAQDQEDPIDLEAGSEKLEFRYTALSYEVPRKVLFRYILEGYDKSWVDAGTRRTAFYTNLPPGDYRFRVQACNNDGIWNEEGADLSFRKLPYYYETAGFTISMTASGLLVLFGLYRVRIRRMEKREHELEALVSERTMELKEASLRDSLTGLRNRRFVSEIVKPEAVLFAERKHYLLDHGGPRSAHPMEGDIGIYILDIDHFKEINDTLGHDAGDRILRQFADVLANAMRKDDILARWGGEEFLVVLRNTSRDYIEVFADKIRKLVAQTEFLVSEDTGKTVRRTCSIGYVSFPFHPRAPELLGFEQAIMLADLGLYHSKRNGRNRSTGVIATDAVPDPADLAKLMTSLDFGTANNLVKIRI